MLVQTNLDTVNHVVIVLAHINACVFSKADVNAENLLDKKPLHLAAYEGHSEIVSALLAAGTKVHVHVLYHHIRVKNTLLLNF